MKLSFYSSANLFISLLCFVFPHLLTPLTVFGEIIPVGNGSYTTDLPPTGSNPVNEMGSVAFPIKSANISGPIPTTDWWTSIVYKYQYPNFFSETLAAHPLVMKCHANGLGVGTAKQLPLDPPEDYSYAYPYVEDVVVGLEELNSGFTVLDDYSDWTVTAKWESGGSTLRATIGHGLPYVYFTKEGNNVQIEFMDLPTVWFNQDGVLGVTINDHFYGIFGPSGCTWTISENIFQSDLNGNDYFSMAALPDNSPETLEFFRSHAYAFVSGSEISWSYDRNTSMVTTNYELATSLKEGTETETLVALYRHQWLHSEANFLDFTYPSPRGQMKVMAGNSFSTEMIYPGILPGLPNELDGSSSYDQEQLASYINELADTPLDQLIPQNDTYFEGKDLGKIAAVVRIADQIGNTIARDYFFGALKTRLEDWLTASEGEENRLFYYNSTWGTIYGYPAAFNTDRELNDHHFHWGYFIMAAVTVAQYDLDWADEDNWGGMVNLLIGDVASWDRDGTFSEMFPFLRCYDIYAGHSWASGHAGFEHGNNQESSSEALNFSAATALWGALTGNTTIRDLGIFLFTNELYSAEQYWFDIDHEVFPQDFEHSCLGIVWGTKGTHSTWFSGDPEKIHGINFLPITSVSLYLGRHPDYILENYNEIIAENGGDEDEWVDIIWKYLALADPESAISKFNNNLDYDEEGGETKAHTYYWLHNLNSMGRVDMSVTADRPCYVVLRKDNVRTYIVYNPDVNQITVNFSDGYTMSVSAGELLSASATVSAVEKPSKPRPTDKTNLHSAYPNPFKSSTTIRFDMLNPGPMKIAIYNLNGQLVKTLIAGKMESGVHSLIWNGTDENGKPVPSGAYLYRLQTNEYDFTRRVILLK